MRMWFRLKEAIPILGQNQMLVIEKMENLVKISVDQTMMTIHWNLKKNWQRRKMKY